VSHFHPHQPPTKIDEVTCVDGWFVLVGKYGGEVAEGK